MNENEKRMIEDMAEVLNQASDKCFATECEDCKYYRADDDYYRCKGVLEAEALYNANYRKIADNEIVIKKDEYGTLKAQNDTLELYNKDLKYTNKQLANANKLFAKRNDELLDELQECTDIKAKTEQETAREILQEFMTKISSFTVTGGLSIIRVDINIDFVKNLVKKYGLNWSEIWKKGSNN